MVFRVVLGREMASKERTHTEDEGHGDEDTQIDVLSYHTRRNEIKDESYTRQGGSGPRGGQDERSKAKMILGM